MVKRYQRTKNTKTFGIAYSVIGSKKALILSPSLFSKIVANGLKKPDSHVYYL
jgi:hypothetical protein